MRHAFFALFAALLLAACGGSGGGPAAEPAPTIQGIWQIGQFTIGPQSSDVEGAYGSLTFNEDRTVRSSTTIRDSNGDGAPAEGVAPFDFNETDLHLDVLTPDGTASIFHGALSEDRSVGIGMSVFPQTLPTITVQARGTTPDGAATLSGGYHVVHFGAFGNELFSWFASGQFDGAGLLDLTADPDANLDGRRVFQRAANNLPYGVDADGVVRIGDLIGAVTSDGELAVVSGPTVDGRPEIQLYARQSTSAGPGTFRGEYTFVEIARDSPPGVAIARIGRFSAAGDGTARTLWQVHNEDGRITQNPSTTGFGRTYDVAPDGSLSIDEFFPLRGAVSPSGRYAILTTAGGHPITKLVVMIRRSPDPLP